MKILVTGGTGTVGKEVVQALLLRGESVRVLTRNKEAKLPDGAEAAIGDLLDPDSVRSALNGVDKLFLLVGNAADELTQALLTVAVARQAKVKQITYLPVYQAERFPAVPHFIGKYTIETSLRAFDTPFTVLRPGYFFQNDAQLKPVLTEAGLYPARIGKAWLAMDVRLMFQGYQDRGFAPNNGYRVGTGPDRMGTKGCCSGIRLTENSCKNAQKAQKVANFGGARLPRDLSASSGLRRCARHSRLLRRCARRAVGRGSTSARPVD